MLLNIQQSSTEAKFLAAISHQDQQQCFEIDFVWMGGLTLFMPPTSAAQTVCQFFMLLMAYDGVLG